MDEPICGFDLTIGRARILTEIAMPRFAPGSAQTIGASLGLGLVLAREYLKRAWSVVGMVSGKAPTVSVAVFGDLPTSAP